MYKKKFVELNVRAADCEKIGSEQTQFDQMKFDVICISLSLF
jgi:hypothetical protein